MWGLLRNKTTGSEPFCEVGGEIVTTGCAVKIMGDLYTENPIAP
jgi:hypothetical protein